MENNSEIEKTLNSLDGLRKAEPGAFFYEKVMMKLEGREAKVVAFSPALAWKAAACFGALIVLNVFVWMRSNEPVNTRSEQNNPLAQEYFSHLNNTIQF